MGFVYVPSFHAGKEETAMQLAVFWRTVPWSMPHYQFRRWPTYHVCRMILGILCLVERRCGAFPVQSKQNNTFLQTELASSQCNWTFYVSSENGMFRDIMRKKPLTVKKLWPQSCLVFAGLWDRCMLTTGSRSGMREHVLNILVF